MFKNNSKDAEESEWTAEDTETAQAPPTKTREQIKTEHAEMMAKTAINLYRQSAPVRTHVQIQQQIEKILAPVVKPFMDDSGGILLIEIADGIAKKRSIEWLASYLAPLLKRQKTHVSAKALREHIRTWIDGQQKSSTLPRSFSLDPNEITFNRIRYQPTKGSCPTWDSFIESCGENGEAMMAFIWSILESDDQGQQYLFLKGQGGDGKGSLIRWLDKLLNSQLVGLSASDNYWPAMCIGVRLGVFNDLNNTAIIMSSNFKQITGRDKIAIQQKYEKAYVTSLDTKFILTTNLPINITGSNADRRRAILVDVKSPKTRTPNYEQKLLEETPTFLFKCKCAYEKLYDREQKGIRCDYSFFDDESENFEELYEAIFDRNFSLSPNDSIRSADFYNRLRTDDVDDKAIGRFKDWLKRTHGVSKARESDGKRLNIYRGIKLKLRI